MLTQIISIEPGESAQRLHRDQDRRHERQAAGAESTYSSRPNVVSIGVSQRCSAFGRRVLSDPCARLLGMGKRNRQRRTAKQKHRRRSTPRSEYSRPDPEPDRAQLLERLVIAVSTAAGMPTPWRANELLEQSRGYERELDVAADLAVQAAIRAAWERGWSPTDLHEVARRRVEAPAVCYLDEAIALESLRYSVATLHPRWRAELADISTGPAPSAPQMWRWAASRSVDHRTALTVVLQVLHLLGTIPRIDALLPLPGSRNQLTDGVGEVDEKILARVRALLAKAESTEYPDEAEALSAKAQALMIRHSLQGAVADHDDGRAPVVSSRRIWIDNPYVAAKVALVQTVAQANRCRTVWIKDLGCVVAVGSETDLNLVELLTTSLLVQATRAMLTGGRQNGVRGQSNTKSFRFSFLVAYASRIGERLTATNSSVTEELQRDNRRLLPVLVAQNRAAEAEFARLFPGVVATPLAAYDSVGLGAGRSAADMATLDVRDAIAG
ncbi:DUF2786 domain-containing protein [Mycolicibacterium monacense]|uniref:DUF2786 domain-containing protein n=1 Tax=Mycolicibacterium monacense TaxID=85693 RepID=A0AAD1IZH6_MYCMB|nr:DUF2786 domain-containing protein [Mycolicibacterium monacense]MDA4100415.1 hypothetical protein [Mycolicibacterium monacense DSM 44395]OBB67113.1 hypothetical protein A6B34_20730 [Mycolicibacterium monacense]ORB21363.1 hypothetical protein BST34_09730 [Mycolicibacterium monacense DSM 44395]QHP84681.1 DUF2786 domain-containing protein [Mycolicibacterium monacense DSM 44395]BBZ62522.1 hypothetical protein MMON_38230 [Mycolicibacterium monacense]